MLHTDKFFYFFIECLINAMNKILYLTKKYIHETY
jgi:hypothetical protein